jgi:acetoin:2,6-dichlorophenolindophenol oxidoreductase subunit alpha
VVDLAGDPGTARSALDILWKIRVFEEAVDELFARGLMHGTMHLSIGRRPPPSAGWRRCGRTT